jgi:hypothetical protein
MKNVRNILAVLGVGYLASVLFSKIGQMAYGNLKLSYGSPNFDYSRLLSANPVLGVSLPVTIENMNSFGVRVTSFDGELFYGGVKISNVSLPFGAEVPANGGSIVVLQFDVQALQLVQDLIYSFQNTGAFSTLVNKLVLKGNLETNHVRVPINTTISFV